MDHIWVAFIGLTTANAAVWWLRGRDRMARRPELKPGYKRLVLGLLVWGNVPWLIMGLGMLIGGVETPLAYLRPREADPWVLVWYAAAICIWVLQLWWLFRRGGAEKLLAHPGLFNFALSKASHVKLLACVITVGGIAGVAMAFGHGMLVPYRTSAAGDYTTVFVVYDGFWRVIAVAAGFLTIGIGGLCVSIAWIRRLKIPKWWNRKEALGPGFLLVWSVLWLSLAGVGFSVNLWRSYPLVRAYRDGTAGLAEGVVRVLREQPKAGHAKGDLVEIDGTRLVVDHFAVTPAYKHTIAHGGALREGTMARVWHLDRKILRVDVKR